MKFLDLQAQYHSIKGEVDHAIASVIDQSSFILGKPVSDLEQAVAEYCGVRYGVGLNSGTDALLVSLKALGIGKGDEVITTPFSFFATAETIAMTGATTVFVDIDPRTYTIDPNLIEGAVTKKTRAIMPVHLYGLPADMDPILDIAKRNNLHIIEDAAQAIGATYKNKRVCSLGTTGCLSFFPSKNLGAYGDGGMVVTNDERIAAYAREWRIHGSNKKYHHEFIGDSSRLDTIQAAILLAKLPHLDDWNIARQKKVALYTSLLKSSEVTVPFIPEDRTCVFHQYTLRIPDRRDELVTYLKNNGIPTMVYYPEPLHLQPAVKNLGYQKGSMPVSEQACHDVVSLPIYPELPDGEIERICALIQDFLTDRK